MLLFALAYICGALTIVSPCILPVLPFAFSRADQPFLRRGTPMLFGLGLTFAVSRRSPRSAADGRCAPMNMAAIRPSRFWRCLASRFSFPNSPTA